MNLAQLLDIAASGGAAAAPPSTGPVTFVGGATDYVYPQANTIPLPAGCAAGDYLVMAGSSSSSSNAIRNFAGAAQLLAPTKDYTKYLTVFGYSLTSDDIANGYISATVTYSYVLGVWHAPNGVEVDLVGAVNQIVQYDALIVKGVTTSADHGALVPISCAASSTGTGLVPTPYPSGYMLVGEAPTSRYRLAMLRAEQASVGATGDIDFGIVNDSQQTLLVALKATP